MGSADGGPDRSARPAHRRFPLIGRVVVPVVALTVTLLSMQGCGHGSDAAPQMKRDLGGLEVEGLRWTRQDRESSSCTEYLWGDDESPYYMRLYELAPSTSYDEVVAEVDEHFAAKGYESGSPGAGSKGDITYSVTQTNSDTVEIWLEASC